MSIPFLFKPMRIKSDDDLAKVIEPGDTTAATYLNGVWADGGLLNNLPITAFDAAAGGPQHTLGLMVGVEGRTEINSFAGFLYAYLAGFLGGRGDGQVSATTSDVDRVLVLDTTDKNTGQTMGMLDFKVDPSLYNSINDQSKQP
jgi:predicted acylesterase/phospholipase RssA